MMVQAMLAIDDMFEVSGENVKNFFVDNMSDSIELYKQFSDDPNFQKWLANMVFQLTYNQAGKPFVGANRQAGA